MTHFLCRPSEATALTPFNLFSSLPFECILSPPVVYTALCNVPGFLYTELTSRSQTALSQKTMQPLHKGCY